MIKVSRFNGETFFINSDLIEFIEPTPDTVITTTTGKKIVVRESVEDLVRSITKYKRKIYYRPKQPVEFNSDAEMR